MNNTNNNSNNNTNFKTSICSIWLRRGTCNRPNCTYAHGTDELRDEWLHGGNRQQHGNNAFGYPQARGSMHVRFADNTNKSTSKHNVMAVADPSQHSAVPNFAYREQPQSPPQHSGKGQQQEAAAQEEGIKELRKMMKKLLKEELQKKGGSSRAKESDEE